MAHKSWELNAFSFCNFIFAVFVIYCEREQKEKKEKIETKK